MLDSVGIASEDLLSLLQVIAETKLTKVDTIAQILRRERRTLESKKRNRELLGV